MHFTKVEGLGNDFVLIDSFVEGSPAVPDMLAVSMCDRHRGVGADGVLLVGPSNEADIEMRLFNADGSEAEMCGNGLRCVALYARRHGLVSRDDVRVSTLGGIKTAEVSAADGLVRVDMGAPDFTAAHVSVETDEQEWIDRPLEVLGRPICLTCVSMGNPHAVTFLRDGEELDAAVFGPAIERHPAFPRRTNVEFVRVEPEGLRVVVWERGAGFTLACGTGACASVAASARLGLTSRIVKVHLPGGALDVEWGADGRLYMKGPASEVFEGQWPDVERNMVGGNQR